MRKLLLGLFCIVIVQQIFAQAEYKIVANVKIWDGVSNHDSRCPNYYKMAFNFSDHPNWFFVDRNIGYLSGSTAGVFSDTAYFPASATLAQLAFHSSRNWRYWDIWTLSWQCNGPVGSLGYPIPIIYKSTGCFYRKYIDAIWGWNSEVEIFISPRKIDIKSVGDPLSKDTTKNILPTDDNISVVATKGFGKYLFAPPPGTPGVDTVYNWQFHTGEMRKIPGIPPFFPDRYVPVWHSFPPLINYRDSTVTSARNSIGSSVDTLIGKNVKFRVAYACGNGESNYIILQCLQSAPHIVNATPIPNKCFNEKSASIKIQFDRALKTGETLNIFLDENKGGKYSVLRAKLDSNNSFTWKNELPAGKYQISLLGSYPDSSVRTYTSGAKHFYTLQITDPPKLTFTTIKQNDVRCYGGNDGAIKITATGGVGNYKVGYKKTYDTIYTWKNFTTATTYTIAGLDTGTYNIRVADNNGCYEKDISNNEVIRSITTNQPAEPVKIDFSEVTDPLGFGRTDGKIKVIVKGGTKKSDGSYNITWKKEDGTILSSVSNTNLGTTYQTLLQNIGKGKYIINVTDSNFSIASSGATEGCMLTDTFTVNEPPPIIINIQRQQEITCKNDADGELVAHVTGGVPFTTGSPYKYRWFKREATDIDLSKTDSIASDLVAGNYVVKITDKNGIDTTSNVFILTEPDSLKINFTTSVIACTGKGNITANITGGTAPYHIEWTTADTTTTISNLTAGNYLAYVKDAHGCETQATIKLVIPNAITIDNAITQNPSYYNSKDGAIQLNVSGGNPPYTYRWSDGSTTKDIQNLLAGTYSVTITDSSGCTQTQTYTLQNPPRIIQIGGVPLGNGITTKTLCNGQQLDVDATIADNAATYQWNSDNGFSATTPKVTLTTVGKYWITVVDSRGVTANDTLIIKQSNANINASFVVSTQAFRGEKVAFVNISYPSPDRISWIIPSDPKIEIVQNNQNLAELIFRDTGTYTISMKAFIGDCEQMITKKVIVVQGQNFDDIGATQNPFIKEFSIMPNPNTGQFNVKITLQEQAKIRLRMMNITNSAVINNKELSGSSQYIIPYTITAASGVYILLLETPKGNLIQKIIIN